MPDLTRIAAPAPFELWLIGLADAPSDDEIGWLSAPERARAERFAFDRDRRRHLAAHCGLRRLLSARLGVDAGSLRFREGPFGKPYLDGRPACAFNLSHSHDVALVALADDGEIGVDVEVLRHFPDALALAGQHYTASERAALAGRAGRERDLAFLFGWTRKEACLKAVGSGLSIPADTFEAGLAPERRTVPIGTPQGVVPVEVLSLRHALAGAGCIVASLARLVR